MVLWGGQEVVEAGGEAREEEPQGRSRASLDGGVFGISKASQMKRVHRRQPFSQRALSESNMDFYRRAVQFVNAVWLSVLLVLVLAFLFPCLLLVSCIFLAKLRIKRFRVASSSFLR